MIPSQHTNQEPAYKIPYWLSKLEEIIDYAKQKTTKENYETITKYQT